MSSPGSSAGSPSRAANFRASSLCGLPGNHRSNHRDRRWRSVRWHEAKGSTVLRHLGCFRGSQGPTTCMCMSKGSYRLDRLGHVAQSRHRGIFGSVRGIGTRLHARQQCRRGDVRVSNDSDARKPLLPQAAGGSSAADAPARSRAHGAVQSGAIKLRARSWTATYRSAGECAMSLPIIPQLIACLRVSSGPVQPCGA